MRLSLWVAMAAMAGLAGCAAPGPGPACRATAGAAIEAELLFGLSMPQGGAVSAASFDRFVDAQIAPRFPAGFTVVPAAGVWQRQREGARLVVIAAPDDDATAAKLQAIRAAYRAQFRQQTVGLITVRSCADFGPGGAPAMTGA